MQEEIPISPTVYGEDIGGLPASSIDVSAVLIAILRRWKLITITTLFTLFTTYGVLKFVPSNYKSTVEILIYDPQRQIDAAIQKPISPFVDAVSFEAMNTEIKILKSKSVALRVAKELRLDKDPDLQSHGRLAELSEWLGFPGLGQADNARTIGETKDEEAERLDKAADILRGSLDVYSESYTITVSVTSANPTKAQLVASTIANDYLASQREARQEALQRVATWLKSRVDDLQSQLSMNEASIEKLKAELGIRDIGSINVSEKQIGELNTQLIKARAEVNEKRASLDQARHVIDTHGDIQSIPELTASSVLTELRQKQTQLSGRVEDLKNKVGEHHASVIAIGNDLAGVNRQMNAEAEHILGNMKNAYDIAVRREQSLEASIHSLTSALGNSEAYIKLQQLQRVVDATRDLYNSYLSQYNEIAQRRTLQDASARIISPATLPTSANSRRRILFYTGGGMLGLGGGLLLAFLLEYFRSGVRTEKEVERFFGHPVLGIIPLVQGEKYRRAFHGRILRQVVNQPLSHFIESVHTMRINLSLWNANPKVILITSALPAEGKSTVAMLLAASSASAGKRTILIDCDFRHPIVSETFQDERRPGLSELLRGTAKFMDVVTGDPLTDKSYVIPAGTMVPNSADLLMSERMRDLVTELRGKFDYVILDTGPLLPVIDALAVATIVDVVLMVVEWDRTPRAVISEAIKILGPEAHRVAGIVFNKVDLRQLEGYGYSEGYRYRFANKYVANA